MKRKNPTELLKNLSEQLKPLNAPDDLVQIGLAGSTKTLANKRSDGTGPDYIKIRGTGIRYPKDAIINWLERSTTLTNI
jgi:hypothetical protein